jgi:hypothetical protein
MKRGDQLKFLQVVGDPDVHLRIEAGVTLCGIKTAECQGYMTGPADAADAPEPTCAVCIERQASPDLAAQLLDVARERGGARRRLRIRS